jgi:hypothetical protein
VQSAFDVKNIIPGILTPQQTSWGITSLGSYRGIPLLVNEISYVDKTGTTQFYVPPASVLVATTSVQGMMSYAGIAQAAEDGSKRLDVFEGARIPLVWLGTNSDSRKVRLASRPCPIPPPIENWMVVDASAGTAT